MIRVKGKQTYKKVQMVLQLHSAFIRRFLIDRIQSAKILHDYHNVPLKNASSMMTAARNCIQCMSTSCVICRHVTKFCENFPNEWRKLSQSAYYSIDHFTVVGLVTWPLNGSEAGVDLVLIQTSLFLLCKSSCSYAN